MKNKILIFGGLLLFLNNLQAYDYNIKKGWNQFGAMSNITDLSVFNKKDCVDYLWRYDNSKNTPIWKLHIANDVDYAYSGETLQSLKPTEGFWLKASSSCIVTINTPDLPPAPPELGGNENSDKTYASCKQILDDGKSTGDGIYTIDPDGKDGNEPFEAYCDMTTDGGGWTLVVQQSTKGQHSTFDIGDSNYNECLLNTDKDCTELSFLSKQIKGTSYMKQVGSLEKIVVKFNDNKERTWWDMSANIPESELNKNVISTYLVSDPNTTFKGFGSDWSPGASGCQDTVAHWGITFRIEADTRGAFAHSTANTLCEDNKYIAISNINEEHKNDKIGSHYGVVTSGVYVSNEWYKYSFIYVK